MKYDKATLDEASKRIKEFMKPYEENKDYNERDEEAFSVLEGVLEILKEMKNE